MKLKSLGMGGQGKTQVALEFCHMSTLDAAFEYIYWIDCSTSDAIILDIENLAKELTHGKAQFPDTATAIKYVKETLAKSTFSWLLVFDNLDDPKIIQNMNQYIPGNLLNGSILYTSRHADAARLGTPFHLEGLLEDEAIQLLLSQSHVDMNEKNKELARDIVKELGFLPLAIDQANSYIHSRRLPLEEFLPTYSKRKEMVLKHTPKVWEYKRQGKEIDNISTNAFTTWELSLTLLLEEPHGEDIAHLLNLSAFYDNQNLHSDLFSPYVESTKGSPGWTSCVCTGARWDEYKFQDIVADLLSLSLIQGMDLSCGMVYFTLHPLVRDWILLRTLPPQYDNYSREAILALGLTLEQTDFDNISLATRRRIISNMDSCMQNSERICAALSESSLEDIWFSLKWFADCYLKSGKFEQAKTIYELLTRSNAAITYRQGSTCLSLAVAYEHLGLYEKAKSLYEIVVSQREQLLGKDHIDTQWALNGLACIQYHLKNYQIAVNILESIVKSPTLQHPDKRDDLVKIFGQLGNMYHRVKLRDLARRCYEVALVHQCKSLGPRHQTTLITLEGLAVVYRNELRVDEANTLYAHIMSDLENSLGWENPRTLRLACNYGIGLIHGGQHDKGVKLLETAAEGFEKLLGHAHPDTLWSRSHLSDAIMIRENTFNHHIFHFGVQSATVYMHVETLRLEDIRKDVNSATESQSSNQQTDSNSNEITKLTAKEAWRKIRDGVEISAKPEPEWKELNSVFDYLGAHAIQAAAAYRERLWHDYPMLNQERGKAEMIQEICTMMGHTYADLLATLEHQYGVGPNEFNESGETQLHWAAESGDLESLRTLLAHKTIEVDIQSRYGSLTPLMVACRNGHKQVLIELLAHNPPANPAALDKNQRSVLMYVVDRYSGSCRSKDDQETHEIVKLLLDTGKVDVSFIQPSPSESHADTALGAASSRGDLASVQVLLEHGARDDARSPGKRKTALLWALQHDHEEIARLLINSAGSDVKATTDQGYTALHFTKSAEMCRMLLDLGAGEDGNLNIATEDRKETPLHEAVKKDDEHIARILLEAGADTTAKNIHGCTPLLLAVRKWKFKVVKILLQFGNRIIDEPGLDGETALQLTFLRHDVATLRVLLEAGAVPPIVDKDLLLQLENERREVPSEKKKQMLDLFTQFQKNREGAL